MHNWDARIEEEPGNNCTLLEDLRSVEKSCKVLGIEKLHRLNFQSSYWQRVFTPVLTGYQNGNCTPNPDILCNREIKFGELFKWAIGNGADLLATGHYARIDDENRLRQAKDLQKDQTYFLGAIDSKCLERTVFPVGNFMKTRIKTEIIREAGLNHLIDRKESMGLCFIGKRRKFLDFISNFGSEILSTPGPIFSQETGKELSFNHRGLSFYTIGQNVAVSGVKTRLYVSGKDLKRNSLQVVESLNHPSLWKNVLIIPKWSGSEKFKATDVVYCSIRSVDKLGVRVESFREVSNDKLEVKLADRVFAPCPGQWVIFYIEDHKSSTCGRICIGGVPIQDCM